MFVGAIRLAERARVVLPRWGALRAAETSEEGILKRKLAFDTRNYFLSKIVPGIMGFLTVLVFVRVVGYDQYGRYAVVFAIVTAFSSGVSGWLSQGVLRFQSSYSNPEDFQRFRNAVRAGTCLSALLGSIVLGMSVWLTEGRSFGTIVVSVGLYVVMLVYTVALARRQASLRSSAVMRVETVRAVGAFVLPLLLVAATRQRHYSVLLLGILFGYLSPLAGGLIKKSFEPIHLGTLRSRLFGRPEWCLLRSLWQYGWPVALWLFCQQSLAISDRYFIQRYLGFSPAGVYASMYDVIVRSFSLVMAPITLAVHTVVMSHWNLGNRNRALRILAAGIKYQLALFLPVSLALLFLAPWVSHLVLGRDNHQAVAIVLPLAVGGFLWQTSLLAHKPLEVLCQTKRMLVAMLAALVVNAAGNFLLIPKFGLKAPAYLSVTSSLVYLAMLWVFTPVDQLKNAIGMGESTPLLVAPSNHLTPV